MIDLILMRALSSNEALAAVLMQPHSRLSPPWSQLIIRYRLLLAPYALVADAIAVPFGSRRHRPTPRVSIETVTIVTLTSHQTYDTSENGPKENTHSLGTLYRYH